MKNKIMLLTKLIAARRIVVLSYAAGFSALLIGSSSCSTTYLRGKTVTWSVSQAAPDASYKLQEQDSNGNKVAGTITLGRHEFPESVDSGVLTNLFSKAEFDEKSDWGICFSGGGTRSAAATCGQLRGLRYLQKTTNLAVGLDKIKYISAVSGGSWCATPFTFIPKEKVDSFLGSYVSPEKLVAEHFDEISVNGTSQASSFIVANSHNGFASRFLTKTFWNWITHDGDRSFANALAEIYLSPFALDEDKFITLDSVSRDRIVKLNKAHGLSANDFYVSSSDRPFLIVNTSIKPHPGHDLYSPYRSIRSEITPLYVGIQTQFEYAGCGYLRSWWPILHSLLLGLDFGEHLPIGGGYTEPFSYDSAATGKKDEDGYTPFLLRSDWNHPFSSRRFRMADAMAASGAAPAISWGAARYFGFPKFQYWCPAFPASFPSRFYVHGDGGLTENTGILALLARRVKNIIVFVNAETPFNPDFPAKDGELSDTVRALFGKDDENLAYSHQFNKVFGSGYKEMLTEFRARAKLGLPLWHSNSYYVLPNNQHGIQPYTANIHWFYLGPTRYHNGQRNAWVEQLITRGQWQIADITRDFKNFPNYGTFLESGKWLKAVELTTRQASALAHYTAWSVVAEFAPNKEYAKKIEELKNEIKYMNSIASVHARWKTLPDEKIRVVETTQSDCGKCDDIVIIKTATDGDINLECREIKYFDVNTQDGEWTWFCGGSIKRTCIPGASVVRASRSESGKTITWERVLLHE